MLYTYLEAIPAGRLDFPNSVMFMIAGFPELFGTTHGDLLREWCQSRGWVLLWSLGLNLGDFDANFWTAASIEKTFVGNQRLIDPAVLEHTSIRNVSSVDIARDAFETFWKHVRTTRERHNETLSNTTMSSLWNNLTKQVPAHFTVDTVDVGDCADLSRCLGVSRDTSNCVCYE